MFTLGGWAFVDIFHICSWGLYITSYINIISKVCVVSFIDPLRHQKDLFFCWHFCHMAFQSPLNVLQQLFRVLSCRGKESGSGSHTLCHHVPLCVSVICFLSTVTDSRADGRVIILSLNFLKPCWLSRSSHLCSQIPNS